MKKALALALIAISPLALAAQPAAEKWFKDFRSLQWKSTDALFLQNGTRQQFMDHRRALETLTKRPPTSGCGNAATNLVTLWDLQMDAKNTATPITLAGATRQALTAGEWSSVCDDEIENLK